jgi:hypothetical protein
VTDDRCADGHAGGDAHEPRRGKSGATRRGVEPECGRNHEPAAEKAPGIPAECRRGGVVSEVPDRDEGDQRERVDQSRRMISSASSRVKARSVSVSSAP